MRTETTYTPDQLETAEQLARQFAVMPKKTRTVTAMVVDAFLNGLMAGQAIRENEEPKKATA